MSHRFFRNQETLVRTTVVITHDDILCHINKPSCEITGVGRLECRIGKTFTGTVCGNEVLEYRQAFTEAGLDREFDDLSGRVGHESTHTSKLGEVGRVTTGTGITHHEDWIQAVE